MNTELKKNLTALMKNEGADLVKFRCAAFCRDTNVKRIFPEAETVICIAFRQLRGTKRGIEDGTTYYQYTCVGVETLEEVIMPGALLRGCALLEDAGFSALPQRRNQLIMAEENSTNFEVDYAEIYRGKTAEKQLDFELCAEDCGLGERGLSGSILTDEFGPFVRYVFILTDAEFDCDEKAKPHLCDGCRKCFSACPGHAFDENGKRDPWQCAAYYAGASRKKNPFMPPTAFAEDPEQLAIIAGEAKLTPERAKEVLDQMRFYPPIKHAYKPSICGRACDTACYVHLEEKGVLTRKFATPFRKRPEWFLDLEGDK